MGAQTKDNTLDPRQLSQYLINEEKRRESARENARFNQQIPQEQEVGIGNYERQQQESAQQQDMVEPMQQQRAENTPTPGSGIAFGPGRSNRGDVDLRRLLQDRMTRGN